MCNLVFRKICKRNDEKKTRNNNEMRNISRNNRVWRNARATTYATNDMNHSHFCSVTYQFVMNFTDLSVVLMIFRCVVKSGRSWCLDLGFKHVTEHAPQSFTMLSSNVDDYDFWMGGQCLKAIPFLWSHPKIVIKFDKITK